MDGWVKTSGISDRDSQPDEFNIQRFRANGVKPSNTFSHILKNAEGQVSNRPLSSSQV